MEIANCIIVFDFLVCADQCQCIDLLYQRGQICLSIYCIWDSILDLWRFKLKIIKSLNNRVLYFLCRINFDYWCKTLGFWLIIRYSWFLKDHRWWELPWKYTSLWWRLLEHIMLYISLCMTFNFNKSPFWRFLIRWWFLWSTSLTFLLRC